MATKKVFTSLEFQSGAKLLKAKIDPQAATELDGNNPTFSASPGQLAYGDDTRLYLGVGETWKALHHAGAAFSTNQVITSTKADGAPFVVADSTRVDNLKAELLGASDDTLADGTHRISAEATQYGIPVYGASGILLVGDPTADGHAANKGWVDTQVANLVDSSPEALDTLNELAAALGDDAAFSTTVNTSLSNRLRFDAAQTLTSGEKTQGQSNLGLGSVATLSAIGASEITDGSVDTAELADDAVDADKLDDSASFTMAGLTATTGTFTGNVSIANTTAAPTNQESVPPVLTFDGYGWDSNSGSDPIQGKIELLANYGDYGSGATQPVLAFSVKGAGGLGSESEILKEGLRILADGKVGIGADPSGTLHVSTARYGSDLVEANSAGSGTAWTGASGTTPPTGWTSGGTDRNFTIDSGTLKITAGTGNAWIKPTFNTTNGKRYKLEFIYKNTSGHVAQYSVDAGSSFVDLASTTSWSSVQTVYFTGTGANPIYLVAKTTGHIIWVDDVKVTEDLLSTSASLSINGAADDLVVANSGNAGITVLSKDDEEGALYFADRGATHAGGIYFNHVNDSLNLTSGGGTLGLSIDSSQNVKIPTGGLGVGTDETTAGALTTTGAITAGGALAGTTVTASTSISTGTGTGDTAGMKMINGTAGLATAWATLYAENLTPSATNYAFGINYAGNFNIINAATTSGVIEGRINNVMVSSLKSTGLEVTGAISATGALTVGSLDIGHGANGDTTSTAIGTDALDANVLATTALRNTAVGQDALGALNDNAADDNVAVGAYCGDGILAGTDNVAMGSYALSSAAASNNTAIGRSALEAFTGSNATAVGSGAADAATSATNLTAVGYNALGTCTEGAGNTAVGSSALGLLVGTGTSAGTGGDNNTALGYAAGYQTTGLRNTLIGTNAGAYATTIDDCIAIGYNALQAADSAGDNSDNATGNYNVAVGNYALDATTSGNLNVAVGYKTASDITTASASVFLGAHAGETSTGACNNNVFLGAYAGQYAGKDAVVLDSIAIGRGAFQGASSGTRPSGDYNIAIGSYALDACTVGTMNIAIGRNAAGGTKEGIGNIAIGDGAMLAAAGTNNPAGTRGDDCVVVGRNALATEATGADGIVAIGTNALNSQSVALANNTAVGYFAADNLSLGKNSVYVGYQAGGVGVITGGNNVVVGKGAALNATGMENSVFIGKDAGGTGELDGTANVCIGKDAGKNFTNNDYNVCVGRSAMDAANDAEHFNVAIGTNALGSETSGADFCVAIGHDALASQDASVTNIAIGGLAGDAIEGGDGNTLVGYAAGSAIVGGNHNTALGNRAFISGTGGYNVAVGSSAGAAALSGDNNTLVGTNAGAALTDGPGNVLIGKNAGTAMTTSDYNVAIGYAAADGLVGAANYNIAIGDNALGGATTATSRNIAIGSSALTHASYAAANVNVAIGYGAGQAITSGTRNTLVGDQTGAALAGNSSCTGVGYNALTLATGGDNTAVGTYALAQVGAGAHNVAVGLSALYGSDNEESFNTAVGNYALYALNVDDGDENSALGYNAGRYLSDGSTPVTDIRLCTYLGAQTRGSAATGVENETAIGYGAVGQGANTVTLGNADVTTIHCARINSQTVTDLHRTAEPSLRFDGSDSYVNLTGGTEIWSQAQATISMWFKVESLATNALLMLEQTAYTDFLLLRAQSNGQIYLVIEDDNSEVGSIQTTASITANTWHHVAVTCEGTGTNETKIYLDGVKSAEGTFSKFTQHLTSYNLKRLGYSRWSQMTGEIKDFRFHNRALDADEVAAAYNGESTPWKYAAPVTQIPSHPLATGSGGVGEELVSDGDMSSSDDWSFSNGSNISGGVAIVNVSDRSIASSTSGMVFRQNVAMFEVGRSYRVSFKVRQTTVVNGTGNFQMGSGYQVHFNQAVTTSFVTHSFIANVTSYSNIYSTFLTFGGTVDGSVYEVDDVSVKLIGEVAAYTPRSIGDKWYDETSNSNHGTITGATAVNRPTNHQGQVVDHLGPLIIDEGDTGADRSLLKLNFDVSNLNKYTQIEFNNTDDDANASEELAYLRCTGIGDYGSKLGLYTRPTGNASTATAERLQINGDGSVKATSTASDNLKQVARVSDHDFTIPASGNTYAEINHNLGSANIVVSVRTDSAPYEQIECAVKAGKNDNSDTANYCTLSFASNPAADTDYTAFIIG